jgi:hypothetical protein
MRKVSLKCAHGRDAVLHVGWDGKLDGSDFSWLTKRCEKCQPEDWHSTTPGLVMSSRVADRPRVLAN